MTSDPHHHHPLAAALPPTTLLPDVVAALELNAFALSFGGELGGTLIDVVSVVAIAIEDYYYYYY